MTKQEIGAILKASRESRGLSRPQVAELIGKSQKTIEHWESGYAQPDANTLFELCDLYGVSIDEVFRSRYQDTDILYISRQSGNETTDDLRKRLHDLIDQLDDEDLLLLKDITIRWKKE